MVRRIFGQGQTQKVAYGQRIGRPPGDPEVGINAFDVPNQKQSKIDGGRQAWAPHRLGVKAGALGFDKIIKSVLPGAAGSDAGKTGGSQRSAIPWPEPTSPAADRVSLCPSTGEPCSTLRQSEGGTSRQPMPAQEFERPVFKRLRRLCLALPETNETSSWGHPNFRAGKKIFCAFEIFGGRPSIAFRVTAAEADRLARKRHFFATPYGRGVWVSRWVDVPVDPKLMATLIGRSYRQVAPKKLVRLLDSSTGRK